MSSKETELPDQASSHNNDMGMLFSRITHSRAVELARRGHYSAANRLLKSLPLVEQSNPEVLDLQARIRAQQGKLLEGENYWKKALEIDPSNEAYLTGLERIRKSDFRPVWLGGLLWRLLVLLASILIIAFGLIALEARFDQLDNNLTDLSNKTSIRDSSILLLDETINSDREETAQRLVSLNQGLDQVSDEIISASSTLEAQILAISTSLTEIELMQEIILTQLSPPDTPTVHIDLPGIVAEANGSSLRLIFEDGLFQSDIELTLDAKEILTALAQQLESYVGEINITIVGYTNDLEGGEYTDLLRLRMYRAVEVVHHLAQESQLPDGIFSVQLPWDSTAPYPNDSDENRIRNRTVVLIITAVEK